MDDHKPCAVVPMSTVHKNILLGVLLSDHELHNLKKINRGITTNINVAKTNTVVERSNILITKQTRGGNQVGIITS